MSATQRVPGWEPIDFLVNEQGDEIQADNIAITIGFGTTALATFAWPEQGQYAICRLVPGAESAGVPDDVLVAITGVLELDNVGYGRGQIIRAWLDEQQRPPAAQGDG